MSVSTIRLLLNPKEAAEALCIGQRKLWSLTIRDGNPVGEIPCVRVGRLVRYRVTDLETWLDRAQAGNPVQPGA